MATPITIPDLGTTVDQVKLLKWSKQEGEPVKRGEVLCEVETDKAVGELESVAEGVLLRQVVPEGAEVETGAIIAYVGAPGEAIPEPQAASPAPSAAAPAPSAGETAPRAPRERSAPAVSVMVRGLARRLGVDLAGVTGTGDGGQITREDVLKAAPNGPGEQP